MAFSHAEVAHRWAHQSGRNNAARGFNMFYDGDTIYSYGAHFPIARIVKVSLPDNKREQSVVLFTTDSYSVSTSKHIGITRGACSHMRIFHVPNVRANFDHDHKRNVERYRERVAQLLARASRRRKAAYRAFDLQDAQTLCNDAAEYARLFRVQNVELPTMPDDIAAQLAEIREAEAKERARLAAETRERRERFEREDLPRWRAGERVHVPYDIGTARYLRVNGELVETSGGASFPVSDARAAFPLLQRLKALCEAGKVPACIDGSHRRIRLGGYSVDHVTAQGVRAGCHFVPWSEVDHAAQELGLINA